MNEIPQRYRILLVEDDAPLASMVADFLSPHGFDVSVEARGDAAIDRIAREQPDAVVLDVNLPGLDGFSVCKGCGRDMAVPSSC
jgi:two-component system, OmpR family, response regulator RstA